MRPSRRVLIRIAVALTTALGVVAVLIVTGMLWPNRLIAARYEVRGVDAIDWDAVADEDLDFAFIKATEGSSHVDDRFAENWDGAQAAGLIIGAYQFMSFDSPGEDQAQNMTATVPATPGMLPPVVDIETYGRYVDGLLDANTVRPILDALLAGLEDHYGAPAIIYTTGEVYDAFIRDSYSDNPIWIRSIILPPRLSDGRDWSLWQYSDRDRVDGIESHVDMNAYAGTKKEFEELRLR